MKNPLIAVFVILILVAVIGLSVQNSTTVNIIEKCKVIDLRQQQLIHGSGKSVSTEIRYLVITDKETFICESSLINGKWNNSDLFFHLKKDSVYTFKVAGLGKGMIYDYRNILEIQ